MKEKLPGAPPGLTAMFEGKVVTVVQSFSGYTSGFYRIRNHRLEYKAGEKDMWEPSKESLSTMLCLGLKVVE